MPALTINTNITVGQSNVLKELTNLCAEMTGKPESYVMIHINDNQQLMFAGTNEAAALCSLTSLGMTDEQTANYSKILCSYLETNLNISAARIYIEFKSPERSLFGWNNGTF